MSTHNDLLSVCIYINKALVATIASNIFYLRISLQQESSNLFKKRHAKNIYCLLSSGVYERSRASEPVFFVLRATGGPGHTC